MHRATGTCRAHAQHRVEGGQEPVGRGVEFGERLVAPRRIPVRVVGGAVYGAAAEPRGVSESVELHGQRVGADG